MGLPKIPKFKGDNSQSLKIWILEFEAQCTALGQDKEKWRDILLCCLEGKAFTYLSQLITRSDGKIKYAECIVKMIENFCSGDYQRTLESKLRGLHFRRGVNISNFVTELRNTIHELYDINDDKAIDLIAINHVTTSLDEDLREPVRILQLSGCASLEGILELIQAKASNHTMSVPEIPSAAAGSQNDRLSRLENLVEGLTNSIQALTTCSSAASAQSTRPPGNCEHCGKPGHNQQSCFKLKTCLKCGVKGHIAKFCRNGPRAYYNNSNNRPPPPHANFSAGEVYHNNHGRPDDSNVMKLNPAPRILLDITVGDTPLKFLYDPGSQYTMIPSSVYQSFQNKPPLHQSIKLELASLVLISNLREQHT